MDRVGEVDRRRTGHQVDDLAGGREDEDLVGEEIELHGIQELVGIREFLLPLDQLAKPVELRVVALGADPALLVFPVRRDPHLGIAMHLAGPDLDLHPLAELADHGRMEGAVAVRLRQGDVVLEPVRHRRPHRVNLPEHRITVFDLLIDDDAEPDRVVDLLDLEILALHLRVDGGDVLQAAEDLGRDVDLGELGRDHPDHVLDVGLALVPGDVQLRLELRRRVGLQAPERVILELLLHPVHAEPVGERHVDVHRLLRDPPATRLLHVLDRPHVVQPIGELDHQDADVLGHRDQHLAEVLRLLLSRAPELDPRDLRESLHEERHPLAEEAVDLLARGERVLQRVVEEARDDRVLVDPQVEQDPGDLERVDQVGLARQPLLTVVDLGREDVGALEPLDVRVRSVFEHLIDDVVDAQHARGSPRWGRVRTRRLLRISRGEPGG